MDHRTLVAAAMMLAVSACAGGGSPAPPSAPAVTMQAPSATPTVPTPAPTAPDSPTPASGAPAAGCPAVPSPTGTQCHVILIRNSAFVPATLTVAINAQVVFINEDSAPHSIVWSDGTPTSPIMRRGESTSREFIGQTPRTLDYTCGIHGSSMAGKIVFDASLPVP